MNNRVKLSICLILLIFTEIYGHCDVLAAENEQFISQLTTPPSPALSDDMENFSGEIRVTGFEFQGQTVFSTAQLSAIALPNTQQNIS